LDDADEPDEEEWDVQDQQSPAETARKLQSLIDRGVVQYDAHRDAPSSEDLACAIEYVDAWEKRATERETRRQARVAGSWTLRVLHLAARRPAWLLVASPLLWLLAPLWERGVNVRLARTRQRRLQRVRENKLFRAHAVRVRAHLHRRDSSPTLLRPRGCQRQARPRSRRTASSSTTSGTDPGGDGPGDPPPPRLALAPPPRAIYSFAGLTAEQRGADVEVVAS
jgi:hypothetical protein